MKQVKKKILVVDDVEINRLLLRLLFEDEYDVIEAEDGRQALAYIQKYDRELQIVLLDLVMPHMDGFAVLREMNRLGISEYVPIILITGESDAEMMLSGYELGVSDYIAKPFNSDVVSRRVRNVIDLYRHKNYLEQVLEEQKQILIKQGERIKKINMFLVDALSTAVEFRDNESGGHVKRIRLLTGFFMHAMNDGDYSDDDIEIISQTAVLHDIGKIAIPDAILRKPGALTNEEFDLMKTHTIRGCEILDSLRYIPDEQYFSFAYDICRHHHERWDGRGYPDGLRGDQIPLWAQCAALADVYDALTNERVYKPAYTHDEAVQMILAGECGVFNPRLMHRLSLTQEQIPALVAQRSPALVE